MVLYAGIACCVLHVVFPLLGQGLCLAVLVLALGRFGFRADFSIFGVLRNSLFAVLYGLGCAWSAWYALCSYFVLCVLSGGDLWCMVLGLGLPFQFGWGPP